MSDLRPKYVTFDGYETLIKFEIADIGGLPGRVGL